MKKNYEMDEYWEYLKSIANDYEEEQQQQEIHSLYHEEYDLTESYWFGYSGVNKKHPSLTKRMCYCGKCDSTFAMWNKVVYSEKVQCPLTRDTRKWIHQVISENENLYVIPDVPEIQSWDYWKSNTASISIDAIIYGWEWKRNVNEVNRLCENLDEVTLLFVNEAEIMCPYCSNKEFEYSWGEECATKKEEAWIEDSKINIAVTERKIKAIRGWHEYPEKFQFQHIYTRYCINVATGNSFVLPAIVNGKKEGTIKCINNCDNVRFAGKRSLLAVLDVINPSLLEVLVTVPNTSSELLRAITIANRYRYLRVDQMIAAMSMCGTTKRHIRKQFMLMCKGVNPKCSNADALELMFKNLKLSNSKTNRKLLNNSMDELLELSIVVSAFKDVNVARAVYDKGKSSIARILGTNKNGHTVTGALHSFICDLITAKGSVNAGKCITSVYSNAFMRQEAEEELLSASELYTKLQQFVGKETLQFISKGNLSEIIKELELQVSKYDTSNIIEVTPELLNLEKQIDSYSFLLARSKTDMVECSNRMKICVGRMPYFFNAMKRGEEAIVFCKDKDDSFKLCIQICLRENKVLQCKGFANARPKDEIRDIALKYFEQCKIKYKNCSDLAEQQ